ncbi:hypothetical protein FACS189434_09450 [Bacteroidia bacterium]|nr:hypothetical protein FACS189434_09450 [Bacteroidia bacterium]
MMIKENFLHYLWQNKLFATHNLQSTDGETVEIIDIGRRNSDAGADFFNAKIKIGGEMWAGCVEIHLKSSDWLRHKHQHDEAYHSVILHVVQEADTDIFRPTGEKIPQLVLPISQEMLEKYETLLDKKEKIRCAEDFSEIPDIFIHSWLNTLLLERLQRKTEHIAALLERNRNDWEEAFYAVLLRNFGFGLNSEPFERLAHSLPQAYLQKHKNSLLQIEAMFFGQAGLLPEEASDEYAEKLKREYTFLKSKFGLQPLENAGWKLLRLRPVNFPHVRMAQFSALVHQSSKLFSKIIEKPDYDYICKLFSAEPSEYWETHYTFRHASPPRSKNLGKNAIDTLIINTIAPFLFFYGQRNGNEALQESALKLLEKIPSEHNHIIEEWAEIGIKAKNAFDTQALIELHKNYCERKDCLRCRIGHKVLTRK